jgi:phage terminase small subunit
MDEVKPKRKTKPRPCEIAKAAKRDKENHGKLSKNYRGADKIDMFCHEYLVDFNATQAAIRCGYSPKSAVKIGYELLQRDDVRAKVDKVKRDRLMRVDLKVDDVLREIMRLAFTDLSEAFDSNGQLLPIKEMPDTIKKAISGVKTYKDFTEGVEIGETKEIKMWDKLKALELLGKYLKMFTNVNENHDMTLERLIAGSRGDSSGGSNNQD